jgi:hypothetical protein
VRIPPAVPRIATRLAANDANSSIASFLFPLFASYKALKTSDPAQLTPWLMYWVVLACALLVESWTDWILVWYGAYPLLRETGASATRSNERLDADAENL